MSARWLLLNLLSVKSGLAHSFRWVCRLSWTNAERKRQAFPRRQARFVGLRASIDLLPTADSQGLALDSLRYFTSIIANSDAARNR